MNTSAKALISEERINFHKSILKSLLICNEKGIHFEIEREYEYEQANLRMKKL